VTGKQLPFTSQHGITSLKYLISFLFQSWKHQRITPQLYMTTDING